jgi:hypothetical protein
MDKENDTRDKLIYHQDGKCDRESKRMLPGIQRYFFGRKWNCVKNAP